MNKLTYSTILLLSSILAFAQRERPSRELEQQASNDQFGAYNGGYETLADGTGGQPTVPIDNYQFLLLGLAVLLIAYFVYRSRQAQQA